MKRTDAMTMNMGNAERWSRLVAVAAIGVIWILPAICLFHAGPGLPSGVALNASAALALLATALIVGHGMTTVGAIVSGAPRGDA